VLQALVFPVTIGLVVYGVAWAAGLIGVGIPPTGLGGWAAAIAVLTILNIILSSGEEIGWRGYMLTRLIDAGVPRPVLASGLIWGRGTCRCSCGAGSCRASPRCLRPRS
jgi:uncharacterized protein